MVTVLLQWIRHHILVFQERKFPSSYEEMEVAALPGFALNQEPDDQLTSASPPQVLWRQFLKFKETELPAKEADKNRSKHIFKSFEVSSPVSPDGAALTRTRTWTRTHGVSVRRAPCRPAW